MLCMHMCVCVCVCVCVHVCIHAKLLQFCLTFCDPVDCTLPGSSLHGILQARILEWVAMLSSKGVLPTQESNPFLSCLLYWQAGSLPLAPPGKPIYMFVCVCACVCVCVCVYNGITQA